MYLHISDVIVHVLPCNIVIVAILTQFHVCFIKLQCRLQLTQCRRASSSTNLNDMLGIFLARLVRSSAQTEVLTHFSLWVKYSWAREFQIAA